MRPRPAIIGRRGPIGTLVARKRKDANGQRGNFRRSRVARLSPTLGGLNASALRPTRQPSRLMDSQSRGQPRRASTADDPARTSSGIAGQQRWSPAQRTTQELLTQSLQPCTWHAPNLNTMAITLGVGQSTMRPRPGGRDSPSVAFQPHCCSRARGETARRKFSP